MKLKTLAFIVQKLQKGPKSLADACKEEPRAIFPSNCFKVGCKILRVQLANLSTLSQVVNSFMSVQMHISDSNIATCFDHVRLSFVW